MELELKWAEKSLQLEKKNGAQGNQAICLNVYIKLLSDLRLGHN